MKGIILAGGSGMRLNPITSGMSKQLVPVYDKPMTHYPLSILMLARIQDVLIITTPRDAPSFHRLLGDGSQLGTNITYTVQEIPDDLAWAFVLSADHIGTDSTALALGDSILYGSGMGPQLRRHIDPGGGATSTYHVPNPNAYGVIEFGEDSAALSVEEKPAKLKSHYAVPGLYFYSDNIVDIMKNLEPSARGEYEITDVNRTYLKTGKLQVKALPRGTTWLDTGTFDSPADATAFIHTVETRQGMEIRAPEEAARGTGFIGDEGLHQRAEPLVRSDYGQYLFDLLACDDV